MHRTLTFALAVAMSASGSEAFAQSPWRVGARAPHVHLPDIATGEPIDLAQFRGKKVLIAEFASW